MKIIDMIKRYGKIFFQVILGWIVVLLFGIIADLEYHGHIQVLQLCPGIVYIIDFLRKYGFHYSNALILLKSSFGILITAVNLILTLSVNITDRFDRLIYGFSHQELNYGQEKKLYDHMKLMTYFAPALLVVAIILNWCITGYLILLFGYLFLLYNHILYAGSFSRQKERELVVDYLLHTVEDDMQGENNQTEYKNLIEYIRRNIEKEGNWRDAAQLYKELKIKVVELPNTISYVLLYSFFDIVYATNSFSKEDIAIQQIKAQVKEVENYNQVNEKEFVLLWGMWNLVFKRFDERNVILFIEWFSKFASRSYNNIVINKHEIDDDILTSEAGLFLIYIEYWFKYYNKEKKEINVESVHKLWNKGKEFLKVQDNALVKECFDAYTRYFDDDIEKLMQCYQILQKDIEFNGNLSYVRSLLE